MLKKRNEFDERLLKFRQELYDEIFSGVFKPGDYLLSEINLSKQYNLSRMSVRKVLADLEEDDLIEKIPGKGNRVKQLERTRSPQSLRMVCFSDSYEIGTLKQLITDFEEDYPYVKVELILLSQVGYVDTLLNLLEEGDDIDLFVISDLHFRIIADNGKLDLLLPSSPEDWVQEGDIYSGLFRLFTMEDRIRAVPYVFSPVVYIYNTGIVSETDIGKLQDWSDLLEFAKKYTIQDENGHKQQYGFGFSVHSNRWPIFMLQNGGQFFTDDRKLPLFSKPESVEALQFCLDLMYKHQVSPVYMQGDTRFVENLFIKNKVALIASTYYYMNEFTKGVTDWDVLPEVPGNRYKGTLLLSGGLAINASSTRTNLAKRFLSFLIGREAQEKLKMNGCTIPALRTVAEDESIFNPQIHPANYHAFKEVMPYAKGIIDMKLLQRELETLQDELSLMWANLESPYEACKSIEQFFLGK